MLTIHIITLIAVVIAAIIGWEFLTSGTLICLRTKPGTTPITIAIGLAFWLFAAAAVCYQTGHDNAGLYIISVTLGIMITGVLALIIITKLPRYRIRHTADDDEDEYREEDGWDDPKYDHFEEDRGKIETGD